MGCDVGYLKHLIQSNVMLASVGGDYVKKKRVCDEEFEITFCEECGTYHR